ncbi:MAG TPA: hypothetical protein VFZ48_00835 [Candidatus Saccharimonadales bacterium]
MSEFLFPHVMQILPVPVGLLGDLDYHVEVQRGQKNFSRHQIRELRELLVTALSKVGTHNVDIIQNGKRLIVKVRPADLVNGVQFPVLGALRSILLPGLSVSAVGSRQNPSNASGEFVFRVQLLGSFSKPEIARLHGSLQGLSGVRESRLDIPDDHTVLLTVEGDWRVLRRRFPTEATRCDIGLHIQD